MNKVILMGRLTKDPEVRYSQGNEPVAVARYTLAVNRRFKRQGDQDADFIGCVAFGKAGEFAEKYFKKGQMVSIVGRLQVRSWEDNRCTAKIDAGGGADFAKQSADRGKKRYATDVIVDEQYFAEGKTSAESHKEHAPKQTSDSDGYHPADDVEDDDFPF